MNVTISWSIGVGATSQNVQYKLHSSNTWITFSTISGSATTETVTGLTDNLIYDFRIITNCAGGTPAPSSTVQKISILCPTVTTTPTDSSVAYSFPQIGGDVDAYVVKIYNADGTTEVASSTPTGTTTLTGTLTGLESSTAYKLRVIPSASTLTKTDCTFVSVTTLAPPVCSIPTDVVATLEPET